MAINLTLKIYCYQIKLDIARWMMQFPLFDVSMYEDINIMYNFSIMLIKCFTRLFS